MMMKSPNIYEKTDQSVAWIEGNTSIRPKVGLILGSGLGKIADMIEKPQAFPYQDIPHFHSTQVEGHSGRMVIGLLRGVPVVCLQGRFHFYEGYPMSDVAHPTRVLCAMGIHTLIQTNAAGGINTRFRAGDLMLIEDHLNLMGANPLVGPHLEKYGARFPDLSEAYHRGCRDIIESVALSQGVTLQKGVYGGLLGPTYETPAEVRMLRTLGADAVGMSTVPETIAANHFGVRVAGISCISNLAAGMTSEKLTHQEVMDVTREATRKLIQILEEAIPKLGTFLSST